MGNTKNIIPQDQCEIIRKHLNYPKVTVENILSGTEAFYQSLHQSFLHNMNEGIPHPYHEL